MKTTTILSTLAVFSATIFAAPAPVPQTSTAPTTIGPFGLMSLRSASDIHFAQISARGSKFWIGKEADTYCPEENEDAIPCSTFGNTTQLRLNGDSLSLDLVVPGGQLVYVGPKGALRFTEPHSASMPPGSTTGNFSIAEYASFRSISHAGGFVACPVNKKKGGYPYQIFVQVEGFKEKGCEGFDLAAVNVTTPAAWEFL